MTDLQERQSVEDLLAVIDSASMLLQRMSGALDQVRLTITCIAAELARLRSEATDDD